MDIKGYIYILTNPSFKEYVKIGYADNVENRLKQLNNSECTPFAFRVYATYGVEDRLSDITLHKLIDQLNPNLRSIDNINGKKRIREFYAMSPEQAYSILESIAIISGCKHRLKLWGITEDERQDVELAQEIEEEHIERLSPFTFSKCNIAVGSKIMFVCRGNKNSGVECMVVDDRNVEYNGKKYSLSSLATELLGSKHGVAGPRYFKYKGEWLNKIRAKLEGRVVSNRLDDVWVIPCNPKYYDVVGAFNKLDYIDWSQTHNANVGDVVYLYVGGNYQSIMFKCEVVATNLDSNFLINDAEFIKESMPQSNRLYMRIKLLEKFDKGQFPLGELRERGLTSVQGRCKATVQLVEYLSR